MQNLFIYLLKISGNPHTLISALSGLRPAQVEPRMKTAVQL